MDEIKQGIGYRATGIASRIFIPPSNKCAFLTLDIAGEKGPRKHDMRAFDAHLISTLSNVAPGSVVTVTGSVDCEGLKDKARQDVQVDGRTAWVEKLTIKTVKVERAAPGSDDRRSFVPDNLPDPTDDVPF